MNRKLLLILITLYVVSLPFILYVSEENTIIPVIAFFGLIYIGYYYWRILGAAVTSSLVLAIVIMNYLLFHIHVHLVYLYVGTNIFINVIFGIHVLINDVFLNSEKKLSETIEELNGTREKFSILTKATYDAIIIVNDRGQITYWNEAAHHIFGYTSDEIINRPWYVLINQHQYYESFLAGLNRFEEKEEHSGVIDVLEIYAVDKNGIDIPVEITISTIKIQEHWNAVAVIRNISERIKAEENIHKLAHYDSLTGLPNRIYFNQVVGQMIFERQKKHEGFTIMLMDMNQFKTINDSLGHEIGDLLLIEVANRLQQCFFERNQVFRFGGDEFIVVITSSNRREHIQYYADKLLELFAKPYEVKGMTIFSAIGVGIARYPEDAKDIIELVSHADVAMYQAKGFGHSKYQFYNEEMHQMEYAKLALHNDLQLALQRQEFLLYYQPQVEIATGTVCGLEALLRWRHPSLGMISPEKFIPIAEETGAIVEIGKWVLRTACQQYRLWEQAGYKPVKIAVNISMKEFRNPKFIETVSQTIEEFGIDTRYLELEITESVSMFDKEYVINILKELKKLGISVSIDDFGMGFSSLNVLKALPIDKLKIDRSFIQDMTSDQEDVAIIDTFITLAKNLKLSVVAEGVETEIQRSLLFQRECDLMQGFLVSPPVPESQVQKFLSK